MRLYRANKADSTEKYKMTSEMRDFEMIWTIESLFLFH